MSQFTRCPACHTVFRVVQDQLRMSDGWVRCGQCNEVFDAKASLAASAIELSGLEKVLPTQTLPAQVPQELVAQPPAFLAVADELPTEISTPIKSSTEPLLDDGPDSNTNINAKHEIGPIEPVLLPDVPIEVRKTLHEPEVSAAPEAPEILEAAEAPVVVSAADKTPSATADVSFMRALPSANPPQSGLRRFSTFFLALLLFAVLAVQVAVLERDRLAAMFPQVKPGLFWVCERLGCTVASLRQIESVVIDSSSFNRAKGDTYRLSLALRNTASVDVALPSIELTLTDSQDQALIRRVLSANELSKSGSTDGVLGASAEWQGLATISVRMAANAERFTGYRVLAFYP